MVLMRLWCQCYIHNNIYQAALEQGKMNNAGELRRPLKGYKHTSKVGSVQQLFEQKNVPMNTLCHDFFLIKR